MRNRVIKRGLKRAIDIKGSLWYIIKFLLYLTMVIWAFTFLYIFIWTLVNSLKTSIDYSNDVFGLPKLWDFGNYIQVLTNLEYKGYSLWGMIGNTFIMMAIRIACAMTFPQMAAYTLARFDFKGKSLLQGIIYFSMLIPIVGTLSATLNFLIVTKMYNTFWTVFIMSSSGLGFQQMVLTTFYKGMEPAYAEAAYMDGASEWIVFLKIYYPQSMPLLLNTLIGVIISSWNDYMTGYLYIPDHPTIALGLQQMQKMFVTYGNDYPVMFAGIILMLIPILIIFACFAPKMLNNKNLGALK